MKEMTTISAEVCVCVCVWAGECVCVCVCGGGRGQFLSDILTTNSPFIYNYNYFI